MQLFESQFFYTIAYCIAYWIAHWWCKNLNNSSTAPEPNVNVITCNPFSLYSIQNATF